LDSIRRYLSNKIGFILFGVRMQKLLRFWFSGFWNFPDRKFRLAIESSARAFLPPKVSVEVPGLLPLTLSNLLFWMCYLTELLSELSPEVLLPPKVPVNRRKFRPGFAFSVSRSAVFDRWLCATGTSGLPPEVPARSRECP
jgi:hypothetical protein